MNNCDEAYFATFDSPEQMKKGTDVDDNSNTELTDIEESAMETIVALFNSFIDHSPYVIGAVAVIGLTWATSALLNAFGHKIFDRWHKRESVKQLIMRMSSLLIWTLGLMLAAIVLFPGLTPAKALGSLGLVSIAVGLAFKDIFENFFAGILILLRFPFERGDFIRCEHIVGKVERVLVRMSYIRETSGELVVVPNSFLFQNPVTVLTNKNTRRVTIMTGVAYDVDVDAALPVIEQAVKSCDSVHHEKPIQVFANGFGSSSIDIEVTWWCDSTPLGERSSRDQVVRAVKRTLDEAGIEIPFPYRTLTFKHPLQIEQAVEK